eukprot:1395990-Rhodomonas_salina.1
MHSLQGHVRSGLVLSEVVCAGLRSSELRVSETSNALAEAWRVASGWSLLTHLSSGPPFKTASIPTCTCNPPLLSAVFRGGTVECKPEVVDDNGLRWKAARDFSDARCLNLNPLSGPPSDPDSELAEGERSGATRPKAKRSDFKDGAPELASGDLRVPWRIADAFCGGVGREGEGEGDGEKEREGEGAATSRRQPLTQHSHAPQHAVNGRPCRAKPELNAAREPWTSRFRGCLCTRPTQQAPSSPPSTPEATSQSQPGLPQACCFRAEGLRLSHSETLKLSRPKQNTVGESTACCAQGQDDVGVGGNGG